MKELITLAIGFIFGAWIVVGLNTNVLITGNNTLDLITACERALPRDAVCYIKAEPEIPFNENY